MHTLLLAVNGTLMRGLPLNNNLVSTGAEFVHDTYTSSHYRLWSIEDKYPAMLRDEHKGNRIEVEIWRLSAEALVSVLEKEPPGLCIGLVELENGAKVFGVLGESYITANREEITTYGGWRKFINQRYPSS